jgi:hypothetical protein
MTDKGLTPHKVKNGGAFVLMAILKGKDEDAIYRKMQGENMSDALLDSMNNKCASLWKHGKLPEGRLPHTSMSAGDVLYNKEKNLWLQCDQIGWKKF